MDYLFADIETVPIADVDTFVSEEPIEAPSNYKDPAKIDAYIAEKRLERLERASLDPDLCRLVCVGWMFDGEDAPSVLTCSNEDTERMVLEQFWRATEAPSSLVAAPRIVTFNGHRFDLLVLMRRSDYLGVHYQPLNVDKYRSPHIDLFQRLTFSQAAGTKHSLRFYAKRFGVPVGLPEVDGSQIKARVEAGDWASVIAHCEDDILITRELARRIGALRTWQSATA